MTLFLQFRKFWTSKSTFETEISRTVVQLTKIQGHYPENVNRSNFRPTFSGREPEIKEKLSNFEESALP